MDHLIYAAPDVREAVLDLERRTGVKAVPGGRHLSRGTHNFLARIDGPGQAYLEIVGPDSSQPPPLQPRPYGIDLLSQARLATWAFRTTEIQAHVERARRRGYDPGQVLAMERAQPDGTILRWKLSADHDSDRQGGVVPFLIDWKNTPHPSATLPPAFRLVRCWAEHPQPELVEKMLQALEAPLEVKAGPRPRLIALVETERGEFLL